MHPTYQNLLCKVVPLCGSESVALNRSLQRAYESLAVPYYEVGVVGLQGDGKSTLINALLGREVLYSSARIATRHIVRLAYAEEEHVVVHLSDGSTQRKGIDYLREPLNLPRDAELWGFVKAPLLQHGIVLVDTPGLNAGIGSEDDKKVLERYLQSVYAVIAICRATKPGIQGFSDLLASLHAQGKQIVVVMTASDLLDEDELEEAYSTVQQQVNRVAPDNAVYAVSALQMLSGENGDPYLHQQFTGLLNYLREESAHSHLHRVFDFLHQCLYVCYRAQQVCKQRIRRWQKYRKSLDQKCKKEEERVERPRARLATLKQESEQKIKGFLEESKQTFQKKVDQVIESINSYIKSHDIPTLNQTLSDKVLSTLTEVFAQADIRGKARNVMLQMRWAVAERLREIGWEVEVPSLDMAIPAIEESEVNIQPVEEGWIAWFKDMDDSIRKAQLRDRVRNCVNRVVSNLIETLERQLPIAFSTMLEEVENAITAHLNHLKRRLATTDKCLEHLSNRKQELQGVTDRLSAQVWQYKVALLLDYLLFGHYINLRPADDGAPLDTERSWVEEQLKQLGFKKGIEATMRALLKEDDLLPPVRSVLYACVLVQNWQQLIHTEPEQILSQYSIQHDGIPPDLADVVRLLKWYAWSSDIEAALPRGVEELRHHKHLECIIIARLLSMAQLSEEEYNMVRLAYGDIQPVHSLRQILRSAIASAFEKTL